MTGNMGMKMVLLRDTLVLCQRCKTEAKNPTLSRVKILHSEWNCEKEWVR
jgi:hypothetical protein